MSEKRYPTRMHEVLGVETGEIFTINEDDHGFYHTLDCDGQIVFTDPEDAEEYRVTADMVTSAINHGITRRPRLTEEQARILKALLTLGFKQLVKDKHQSIHAFEDYDVVAFSRRQGAFMRITHHLYEIVDSLLPSPAPLDIVQTLRDAGGEVE